MYVLLLFHFSHIIVSLTLSYTLEIKRVEKPNTVVYTSLSESKTD